MIQFNSFKLKKAFISAYSLRYLIVTRVYFAALSGSHQFCPQLLQLRKSKETKTRPIRNTHQTTWESRQLLFRTRHCFEPSAPIMTLQQIKRLVSELGCADDTNFRVGPLTAKPGRVPKQIYFHKDEIST